MQSLLRTIDVEKQVVQGKLFFNLSFYAIEVARNCLKIKMLQ